MKTFIRFMAFAALALLLGVGAEASVPVAPGFTAPGATTPIYVPPGWHAVNTPSRVRAGYEPLPVPCPLVSSEATIHKAFPGCITFNFGMSNINTTFAALPDVEVGHISTLYTAEGGSVPALAKVAAQHFTAANLVRFAAAFGMTETAAAVNSYAPAAIASAYFKANLGKPLVMSIQGYRALGVPIPPANPNQNMTLTEVYYEFRTAAENYTVVEALFLTIQFSAKQLVKPVAYGLMLGKGIDAVLDKVSPATLQAIGEQGGQFMLSVTQMDVGGYDGNAWPDTGGCGCSVTVETWNMMVVEP